MALADQLPTLTPAVTVRNPLIRRQGVEPPAVVAHRGYSSVIPENTLAAFEAARLAGVDWIETDVRFTADDRPVLFHDATLDTLSDGLGDIRLLRSSQLATLDVGVRFSPVFAGAGIPGLSSLLRLVADTGVRVLVEIKGPLPPAQVLATLRTIRETSMTDQVLVKSFDVEVLRHAGRFAADHAPGLRLGLLREEFDDDPVAVARELGVVTYNPGYQAVLAEPHKVTALHEADVAVMPWTSDEPDDWQRLVLAGVDAIITNRPGVLIGWLARDRQVTRPPAALLPVTVPTSIEARETSARTPNPPVGQR